MASPALSPLVSGSWMASSSVSLRVWKLHRILRRAAGAALLAFAVSLLFAARASESGPVVSAWADTLPSPSPTATCSADGGPGCTVGDPTSTPTPGTGSAGDCTWKQGISAVTWIYGDTAPPASSWPWLDAAESNSVIAWMDSHAPPEVGTPPYLSMGVVFCPDPDGGEVVVTVGTLGTPPTAANVLGLWAYSQVSWTPPSLGASPPLTAAAVTNLPTYVYLNPGAYQATGTTATVPGGAVSATIVATPVKVVWSTGDGGSVTCPGQGVPYDTPGATAQRPRTAVPARTRTRTPRPTSRGARIPSPPPSGTTRHGPPPGLGARLVTWAWSRARR